MVGILGIPGVSDTVGAGVLDAPGITGVEFASFSGGIEGVNSDNFCGVGVGSSSPDGVGIPVPFGGVGVPSPVGAGVPVSSGGAGVPESADRSTSIFSSSTIPSSLARTKTSSSVILYFRGIIIVE